MATPVSSIFATSGACSYHGGVNCSASRVDGGAVCNDGWTNSSVSYYSMAECSTSSNCIRPNTPQCSTNYQSGLMLQGLQNGSVQSASDLVSGQIQACQSQNAEYQQELAEYNSCLSNSRILSNTIVVPNYTPSNSGNPLNSGNSSVFTGKVTDVGTRSVKLNGAVVLYNPMVAYFEYGTTTSLGSMTEPQTLSLNVFGFNSVLEIEPGTTYYYRATIESRSTTIHGGIKSFSTPSEQVTKPIQKVAKPKSDVSMDNIFGDTTTPTVQQKVLTPAPKVTFWHKVGNFFGKLKFW
ncbi:MAG: hypothetical protein V4504_01115 [Patescibacteria group bacterium]